MKKSLVYILLVLFALSAFGQSVDKRRAQIIGIIDEEISEISRLSSQRRNSPDLLLRVAELNLEKARLWREKENSDFLKIPAERRRKLNKKSYFKRSDRYFRQANSLCLKLVRNYPSYSRKSEAYYILGYNAKEENKQKTAAKYLSRANRTTKDKKTKIKTQITLAEVYYNAKKYRQAVPLYESALSRYKDKWWTKDSFNLAWSYYQINNYNKAISKMKEVYRLSRNKKYIDMSRDVERDLGLFFATSGKIDDGVRFYRKIGDNFSEKLLRIAQNLSQKGQFDKAIDVLNKALKNSKKDKEKVEIFVEMLTIYEKSNNYKEHLRVSNILVSYWKNKKVNENQTKLLNFQMQKVGGTLQRQVISKTYKRLKSVRLRKTKQAVNYFENLALTQPTKTGEFSFLTAETSFSGGFYKTSFVNYKKAFENSLITRSKFKNLSMEGLLASLAKKENANYANNVYVFESYIKHFPRGKKRRGIYPRLFNNYIDKNEYDQAKSVLDRYKVTYATDYKTQEAMIAKLMDIDRKNGNNQAIRNWISAVEAREYAVSTKFKTKLQELLTTIQIEKVQTELGRGNKKYALQGYHGILNDPYSTVKSRLNAKYNLSALYFELGDTNNAFKWSSEAMSDMEVKDIVKFSSSFLTIANYLFTSLEFDKSADLFSQYVDKVCQTKTRRKEGAFKNGVFIALAAKKIDKAINLSRKGRRCGISSKGVELAEFEIMRELRLASDWERYTFYVEKLSRSKGYYARIIDEYIFLKEQNDRFDNTAKSNEYAKKSWNLYYKAKKENESISMTSLDYFANSLFLNMKQTATQLERIKFRFPEQVFEKILAKKFSLLEKVISQAAAVQEVGSGVGIVNSFKLLQDVHKGQSQEIFDFTPSGKSPEYVTAFKKDINSRFGEKLKQSASIYRREASRAIVSNSILNQNNFYFQNGPEPVKFFGEGAGLLMDRGGVR